MAQYVRDRLTQHRRQDVIGRRELLLLGDGGLDCDPSGCENLAGDGKFGGQRELLPVTGDQADLGTHRGADPAQLADLGVRPGVITPDQPADKIGLERYRGQAKAKQVMHVPCDPQSLLHHCHPGELAIQCLQLER